MLIKICWPKAQRQRGGKITTGTLAAKPCGQARGHFSELKKRGGVICRVICNSLEVELSDFFSYPGAQSRTGSKDLPGR